MITAFGDPEGYFSLAIIAFGAFQFLVPKYYYRSGKSKIRSLDSLFKEVAVFKEAEREKENSNSKWEVRRFK